ncbi:MAG: hypothetical protein V4675_22740 [Verrucomicrobiota bacterium]
MKRIDQIITALESAGGAIDSLVAFQKTLCEEVQRLQAGLATMKTLLGESLGEQGISEDAFETHWNERHQIFHDIILRQDQDEYPELSAEMDRREPEDIPLSDEYAPLFP